MPSPTGHPAARPGEVAGVLRLLAYVVLAVVMMLMDQRAGWLSEARVRMEMAAQPLWWLAAMPSRVGVAVREDAVGRGQLMEDNRVLRQALLLAGARIARLQAASAENDRLRGLLGSAERGRLDVRLASILDIDLDPTRQRLVLDAGSADGVETGQVVIDAGGLLGQVVATTPAASTVLLITDPDHAVPVVVARSGVRLIVYGSGRTDQLRLADVPLSGDVKVGDELLTSGLGGRFPPGFAVGNVVALRPDDSRAFLEGEVTPAARLDRGRDVLLLRGRELVHAPEPVEAPTAAGPAMPDQGGRP